MFNPGMFGVSPQQMEAAKEIGQHLRMEIRKYHKDGRLEVRYILNNPQDAVSFSVPQAIDQLAEQLMWGHSTFFDMKGKVINVD